MKVRESKSVRVKRSGITVLIRPTRKDGKEYFVADYRVNGERKLAWRSSMKEARDEALAAIDKIQDGDTAALDLTRQQRDMFLRAEAANEGTGLPLDLVVAAHADVLRVLGGRATPIETARDWLERHAVPLPRKTVTEAADDCLAMVKADGKSPARQKQLAVVFNRFKKDNNLLLTQVSTAHVSQWLAGLEVKERTKRNCRDALGYLNRWCVLRGYLARGTDWLEGVQNYSARKIGEIQIYSPDEIAAILKSAGADMRPFIAVQAFAGLRHAEAARLDWSEIDLKDGFIEVCAAKSKTGERRLVPIPKNLKAWLKPHRRDSGPICEFANTTKQLLKTAGAAAVPWKHNGLRHSFISYRVAECADVPRVSDEAGNSPAIIRQHYLRRVRPIEARKWFSVKPKK
ncbi:MAG TPA: tyrosine-type recombinase/integrase [Candidatus Acidoferrales bacterium]|nr:tyrosine-type recombinase/integrase [Candidatus Acidoferrales bacterium]